MRIGLYAGASTAAAAACLLKAFHERPNFYSATVYLSQSNACLLILTNLLLVCTIGFMYGLQRLLYGPLRPIEIEQLSEKAWYAVLDTLLAMPSFREDVGGWLLTMFVLLLVGKVWGWIGEGRVDILEQQPPANPRLFHMRLATSLLISVAFNAGMGLYCLDTVLADPRPGMMVIFTFEFAIQVIFATFTLLRYGLAVADTRIVTAQTEAAIEARKLEIRAERAAARQNETADGTLAPASPTNEEPIEVDENEVDVPGWEDKRRYLFFLEVVTDFIKLVIYIVFFTVSVTFNGLPMHIMRDVYMTFASFSKRINDFMQYRKATSDMNTRYPDATTEEIRGDACIVCREDMVAWEQPAANVEARPAGEQPAAPAPAAARRDEGLRAKKLPCGHILHLRCLKAWLERQQVCPTCRRPVIAATPPAVPGQAGAAAGANPGAPGAQPGQQPNGRPPVRARFFNLGPVRIGFANGPPNQMNQLVNQLRNPQVQAQPPVAGQEGPNHLGLRDPYLPEGADGARTHAVTGLRSGVPTQIQILQIEQRLINDAHNLQLEHAQLAQLRDMEREMARLRALHIPSHLPVGTTLAAQRAAGVRGIGAVPGFPANFGQEVLQGQNGQHLGSGHEHLPPGMVLPEGWTVMPLQRAQAGDDNPAAAASANARDGLSTAPPQNNQNATINVSADPQAARQHPATSRSAEGPTDDQGSPLFVPTAREPGRASSAPSSALLSDATRLFAQQAESRSRPASASPAPGAQERVGEPASLVSQAPVVSEAASAPQSASDSPWSAPGWSFNPPLSTPENAGSAAQKETAAASVMGEQPGQSGFEGKGKGKAVEMEDAPDPEA
jgi:E3 ubiquitin-protein ligase synoviolin